MPTSDGGIHGGRVRGIGSLFGNCRLNHTLLLWNHSQPRRPNSDRVCKRVRTPSMLTLVRYMEGSRCMGMLWFLGGDKLISGRQMTQDYNSCNAAWESLASLASLGWGHLLHGNHLRSRPLHSDGLRRDVRLRGDLGGSDFWRVRCYLCWCGLATFVVWTQRKIDLNIGGCNSAKRNSSGVGVTCYSLICVNQSAFFAFGQNSEKQ